METTWEVEQMDGGWAEAELGAAQLGDPRRTARLVRLAEAVGAQPSASLPQACRDLAEVKGAYRFFANAEVSAEAIVASHVAATRGRVGAEPVVLAIQDTTLVDWTHHRATRGLGPLAGERQQGLVVHSTLAMTPERVPLGLIAQDVWARDARTYGKADHKTRPFAEKESRKWVDSLAAVNATREACPATHLVSIGDREADVYEVFVAARAPGVDLVVRAVRDRGVCGLPEPRLRDAVAAQPVGTTVTLTVPRRPGQPARQAHLAIRWREVTLRPPRRRGGATHLRPVTVWAVLVVEEAPPEGTPPLDWLLLTTCPVTSPTDALTRVNWYACRWGIEVFHRVLKSGCRLEAKQLAAADRLERCLALYSVVAWRVMHTTMRARQSPAAPCTTLLEPDEWRALYCFIHHTPTPPDQPPSLGDATRWIGRLGGFLGRASDGHPGPMTLWRGFHRLHDLTQMYVVLRHPNLSPTYG